MRPRVSVVIWEPLEDVCWAACVAMVLLATVVEMVSLLGRLVALLSTLVEVVAMPPSALIETSVLVWVPGFSYDVASCCTALSGMLDT